MSKPPRHPVHGGQPSSAMEGGIEESEVDLIHALEERRDRDFGLGSNSLGDGVAVPGERSSLGDLGRGGSMRRFLDLLDSSSANSPVTKPRMDRARTTSEPAIDLVDSTESQTGSGGRNRRQSLQEFHSLSTRELNSGRKIARRALLKRGAGHRRVASLLTAIDETALEGVVPEDGQMHTSDRRPPGITRTPSTGSNPGLPGQRSYSQESSNNKQPLDWGEHEYGTDMDNFITNAMLLDNLFLGSTELPELTEEEQQEFDIGGTGREETIPLLQNDQSTDSPRQSANFDRGLLMMIGRKKNRWKYVAKRLCCFWLNPFHWVFVLMKLARNSFAVWAGVPAAIISWILFYHLNNPELDFLPGHASISWWLNFFCRQMCTLDLARLTEYLYIDSLSLGTAFSVNFFGPYFTLASIQAKGWPFVMCFWSLWDLLLLHGDNAFQVHWLNSTGLAIYSTANSGSYMLNSEEYLRALLALVFIGFSMGAKRTFVALHFGRRTLSNFKPKLEALLQDIVLVAEVAELAEEASKTAPRPETTGQRKGIGKSNAELDLLTKRSSPHMQLPGVVFHDTAAMDRSDTQDSDTDLKGDDIIDKVVRSSSAGELEKHLEAKRAPPSQQKYPTASNIKDSLETWREPINKLDKSTSDASIGDILRFRKALDHMDSKYPFGDAYGPAWTRDESIESAQNTFYRLQSLTRDPNDSDDGLNRRDCPDQKLRISFDVLRLLASDENGEEIPEKVNAYSRLFRPDLNNEVTELAFVQSCDSVYRSLRYFRASVGNASVIDKVLEDFVGNLFVFLLTLVVLAILNFNPWPILASISAVLVSFAFAFGPSAANYVDGMMMIIGRRPYDLGDRIVIVPAITAGSDYDPRSDSWFVEDINLFTTTVRRARDSSVATINNSSIVKMKIVNCQRSPFAQVSLFLKFDIRINDDGNIEKFQAGVEQYLHTNPRSWKALKSLFMTELDAEWGSTTYQLTAIHRLPWQEAVHIAKSRGQLISFCSKLARELGVQYETPVPKRKLLVEGQTGTTENDDGDDSEEAQNQPEPGSDEAILALLMQSG